MPTELRGKQRFSSFIKALSRLEQAVKQRTYTDLEQQGLIQCFEYTLELAGKTMKDYLEEVLHYDDVKGPAPAIKQAFQSSIIDDGNVGMEMLKDRNLMAHSYDEDNANLITNKIINSYYSIIAELKDKLMEEYKKSVVQMATHCCNINFGLETRHYEMIKDVLLKNNAIKQVLIFGSRAVGKEKKSSDIDLALKGENIDNKLILKVLNELDELPVAYKFDVINYNEVSPEFRQQIDKYGKNFL